MSSDSGRIHVELILRPPTLTLPITDLNILPRLNGGEMIIIHPAFRHAQFI